MPPSRPEAQVIEHFHLAFLQVLQARLSQAHYVVKGGVNLRYFFGSHRYSEDVDLDAVDIDPWVLQERIDGVLASPTTSTLLRAGDLAILATTKPKQTDTTQRWKIQIRVNRRREPVRTKIEFSHRPSDPRRKLEAVPEDVVAPYALRPPTMLHYLADAAIDQKVLALAKRSETQARDVFDLDLLLRADRGDWSGLLVDDATITEAIERASQLPFEAFRNQVLPFLDPDVVELYDTPEYWEQMRTFVVDRLAGT
jgi:predicted nucleotidyltransferase component of viral defense system